MFTLERVCSSCSDGCEYLVQCQEARDRPVALWVFSSFYIFGCK